MTDRDNWNGVERRRETPATWSEDVDAQLIAGRKIMNDLRSNLATNTEVTERIQKSVESLVVRGDEVDKKLTPIFEAWDALQTGLKVLGAIGKAGMFVAKYWMVFVGVGAFLWVWAHGGTIDDALKAFWKARE